MWLLWTALLSPALLEQWAVFPSPRWEWRKTSVMLPKPSLFHPKSFLWVLRWIFRLFSSVASFLTWKLSCQLGIYLLGVTMFICLQSLKSEVIVVYPDKHCYCNGSLQKKQTDNSLQAHFYTNMCINIYVYIYMLKWKILRTLSNVNSRNEIQKTSREGKRTKPQLGLKSH